MTWRAGALVVGGLLLLTEPASAESLIEALAAAYSSNPTLNAARASLRAVDEGVPQALAGYRPTISAAANIGTSTVRSSSSGVWTGLTPRGVSFSIEQPIFLGFRTKNGVKAAETAVLAGRQSLLATEQNVLLSAVQAYMNVLQAQAVLNLRSQNLDFLREQLRAAQDRLNVGEGTKTDVAQTQASLSQGQYNYDAALAEVNAAVATYEQIIGHKPKSLGAVRSIDSLLPKSADFGVAFAMKNHPAILAASYNVDVADYNVKILEGALLPTISVTGTASHSDESSAPGTWSDSASLVGRLSIPIYSGGEPSSKVRAAKETLGQRRIELDGANAQIRAAVVSAWGSLDAARAQMRAAQAQVDAQQLVLSGVIEERKVGQQTTLDVLNAQQDLLNAKVALVSAQTARVVAAYNLLSTVGRLTAATLSLPAATYDPTHHYDAVRDKWSGLRTPDGR
jgi:outer membrane protein